jgi:hypothetical protein
MKKVTSSFRKNGFTNFPLHFYMQEMNAINNNPTAIQSWSYLYVCCALGAKGPNVPRSAVSQLLLSESLTRQGRGLPGGARPLVITGLTRLWWPGKRFLQLELQIRPNPTRFPVDGNAGMPLILRGLWMHANG